jgi:hypothetical protein
MPSSSQEWKKIAFDYNKIWNFPQCVGAMDGKHVVIEAPILSGTEFYNYKGTFSIVLFAIVDANYNFIYVNVGCQGRLSDGGVFKSTGFKKLMENSTLNLPEKSALPGGDKLSPYVFVADDAFPLSPNIMKPYRGNQPKASKNRIFNYRLSRARRVVENVFGIMASIFRVFRKPMLLQPEKVDKIVLACVHLHNYLRKHSSKATYNPPGTFDSEQLDNGTVETGSWRRDHQNLQSFLPIRQVPRKSSIEAAEIRDEFSEYFISHEGEVPWKLNYC